MKTLPFLVAFVVLTTVASAQDRFAGVRAVVLDNGLTVVVQEVHEAPLAHIELTYRVGFLDAPDGRTELPHFVEHLLFKGTPRYPQDEFALLVTENGGFVNAFTSETRTTYVEEVPAAQVREILEAEASRMAEVVFEPRSVETEKQVVLSELRKNVGSPTNGFHREIQASLGLKGRELYDLEGRMAGLEAVSLDEVRAFYRRWYRPDNAVLVVAGDVKADEVLAWARSAFGPVVRPAVSLVRPVPAAPPIREDLFVKGRGVVREGFGYRYFNFRPYDPQSRDYVILFFLTATGLIPELDFEASPGGGYLVQKFGTLAPAPLAVLDWSSVESRFEPARAEALARRALGWDDLGSLASTLTSAAVDKADPRYEDWLSAQFATLSFAEVRTFVEHFLGDGPTLVAEFTRESVDEKTGTFDAGSARDSFTPVRDLGFFNDPAGTRAEAYRAKAEASYQTLLPRFQGVFAGVKSYQLSNGLRVVVRQSSLSSKTWVNLLVPAGALREKVPFTAAWAARLTLGGGPQVRTVRALAKKGVTFGNPAAGDDWATVTAQGPGAELGAILGALGQSLKDRTFDPQVLEAFKETSILRALSPTKDRNAQLAQTLKALVRESGAPYYDPEDSSAADRAALTVADLEAFLRANYRPEGSVLVVTSSRAPDEVRDLAQTALGAWTPSPVPADPSRAVVPLGKPDGERQRYATVAGTKENLVVFAQGISPGGYPQDRETQLDLGSAILGDPFTGRMFRELRAAQGLTYAASVGDRSDARRAVQLSGYLLASSAQLDRAVAGWKEEVDRLGREGATGLEFFHAKNKLINQWAFRYRNTEAIHNQLVGLVAQQRTPDQALEPFVSLGQARPEALAEVWRTDVDPGRMLIAVVGPGR